MKFKNCIGVAFAFTLLFGEFNGTLAAEEKSCKKDYNVEITFYGEEQGYYLNGEGIKVEIGSKALNKSKQAVKHTINKHLSKLCEQNVNVEEMLKENPLEINLFPYRNGKVQGLFYKSGYVYEEFMSKESVTYEKDRIVLYLKNEANSKKYNSSFSNSNVIEGTLIHEFAHYIDNNYLKEEGILKFLQLKGLENSIYKDNTKANRTSPVLWKENPHELFAESYAEYYLQHDFYSYENEIMALTEKEKKEFGALLNSFYVIKKDGE